VNWCPDTTNWTAKGERSKPINAVFPPSDCQYYFSAFNADKERISAAVCAAAYICNQIHPALLRSLLARLGIYLGKSTCRGSCFLRVADRKC